MERTQVKAQSVARTLDVTKLMTFEQRKEYERMQEEEKEQARRQAEEKKEELRRQLQARLEEEERIKQEETAQRLQREKEFDERVRAKEKELFLQRKEAARKAQEQLERDKAVREEFQRKLEERRAEELRTASERAAQELQREMEERLKEDQAQAARDQEALRKKEEEAAARRRLAEARELEQQQKLQEAEREFKALKESRRAKEEEQQRLIQQKQEEIAARQKEIAAEKQRELELKEAEKEDIFQKREAIRRQLRSIDELQDQIYKKVRTFQENQLAEQQRLEREAAERIRKAKEEADKQEAERIAQENAEKLAREKAILEKIDSQALRQEPGAEYAKLLQNLQQYFKTCQKEADDFRQNQDALDRFRRTCERSLEELTRHPQLFGEVQSYEELSDWKLRVTRELEKTAARLERFHWEQGGLANPAMKAVSAALAFERYCVHLAHLASSCGDLRACLGEMYKLRGQVVFFEVSKERDEAILREKSKEIATECKKDAALLDEVIKEQKQKGSRKTLSILRVKALVEAMARDAETAPCITDLEFFYKAFLQATENLQMQLAV